MDFDELSEFPRCIKCRARDAHASEMVDLTQAITSSELRPMHPVFIHRECAQ